MLVLGIVLFALGLLFSIAWHELGHFTTARWFGVRVPEFMVGFGPTVFSRRRGETVFGIKAVPLGGYIRMIGMMPPAPGETVGRSRRSGPLQGLIDDVRAESARDVRPGDVDRQFWTRKPWQRVVVMFAGPFMNLVLAAALFLVVLMGFGVLTAQPVVAGVEQCVVPVSSPAAQSRTAGCPPSAPATPALQAGFRPGDRIVGFDGRRFDSWADLQVAIREASGTVPVTVERATPGGSETLTLYPRLIPNQLRALDDPTSETTVTASYLGLRPVQVVERQSPGQVVEYTGEMLQRTVTAVAALPAKIPQLFGSVFLGEQRDPNGPISVVGVSVIGGQVLADQAPVAEEIATMLTLLAAVNLSLFLLNLLPILPLDGGHILPALWEAGKKRIARVRGRPDPGPVDLARMMPVAYGFAVIIMGYGALVILADIVNPISFT